MSPTTVERTAAGNINRHCTCNLFLAFDSKRTYLPQRDYPFDYSQHLLLVKVHQDGSADACLAVWGMLCAVSEWSCGQLRRKTSIDNNSRSSSGDDDRYHSHVDREASDEQHQPGGDPKWLVSDKNLIENQCKSRSGQPDPQNGCFLIIIKFEPQPATSPK